MNGVTGKEVAGVAVGAVAVAAGLKKAYAVYKVEVPTWMWLTVTSGITAAGWFGYKKIAG